MTHFLRSAVGSLTRVFLASLLSPLAMAEPGWFPFNPPADAFAENAGFDLRSLNEKQAGDGGFIAAKDGHFVHSTTGEPVRFWAVNGPPADAKTPADLRRCARMLAKHGVNMVRIHGGYFDKEGNVDPAKVKHALDIVAAMKAEGIYCHFSTYFPLWLSPKAGTPWLAGYDGNKHPFASLYFNHEFQERYRGWWKALLTTPDPATGKTLLDDPAVSSLELVNEDSYFFWTFSPQNIPEEQLRILESQFAEWLKRKYGSLDETLKAWGKTKTPRDNPGENRIGFRGLYDLFSQKTPRDRDTAAFLYASQTGFYTETRKFLKELGFKGVITASNWTTANPQVLGPIEKMSYVASGDFIDRHGYFECFHKGDNAAWSIRKDHTYFDRSALRFDGDQPGKPKSFVNTIMDIHYGGKPSMVSELTFTRPNRYRSECPLYYATYGALQDSDAIVQFALDGANWSTKPGFFVQPWTLMSPAMMGQYPAAALIYRKGLVSAGEVLVDLNLKVQDVLDLQGTPMPQDAAFDDLRAKDLPQGLELKPGNVIDPLVHYAGRTNVNFTTAGGPPKLADLSGLINRKAQMVVSSTKQLKLDYGKGVLLIDAPAAQGASGALKAAGPIETADLSIASELDLVHIVAVSLDGKPLATSQRILLQVMSEEKPSGFVAESVGPVKQIMNLGKDPWLVKALSGTVKFKRADAGQLKVTPLDLNGYPSKSVGTAAEIRLGAETIYYVVAP